jgi:hypothetical protein
MSHSSAERSYNPEIDRSGDRAAAYGYVEGLLSQEIASANRELETLKKQQKERGEVSFVPSDPNLILNLTKATEDLKAIESGHQADEIVKNRVQAELEKAASLLSKLADERKNEISQAMQTGRLTMIEITRMKQTPEGPAADAMRAEMIKLQKYIQALEA